MRNDTWVAYKSSTFLRIWYTKFPLIDLRGLAGRIRDGFILLADLPQSLQLRLPRSEINWYRFNRDHVWDTITELVVKWIRYLAKISSCSRCSLRLLRARYPMQMTINSMGIRQASTMPVVIPAWRELYSCWPAVCIRKHVVHYATQTYKE